VSQPNVSPRRKKKYASKKIGDVGDDGDVMVMVMVVVMLEMMVINVVEGEAYRKEINAGLLRPPNSDDN
jgi:hypothetical protein